MTWARTALLGLLLAAAPPPPVESPLPLGELAPQVLPAGSCAMVLWERATRRRILMALGTPANARIVFQGKTETLDRTSGEGDAVRGFVPRATYKAAGFTIGIDLAITPNDAGGAVIRDGTLTYTAADGGAVVAPVAGLIGCN